LDYFGFTPKKLAASAAEWLKTTGKAVKEQGFAVAAQFEPPAKRDLHYVPYN